MAESGTGIVRELPLMVAIQRSISRPKFSCILADREKKLSTLYQEFSADLENNNEILHPIQTIQVSTSENGDSIPFQARVTIDQATIISTMLPVNRRKRVKILNKFLVRQTSVKLGLWTFDNLGTAPQSVFAFLVNLEDDMNTIMKHVLEIRTELLKLQKIYYPREFRQQLKHYSHSIVDMSRAPTRMLLSMILGDNRASPNAATKLVEERVLDAILSGDEELALDLRAFNGRETKYVKFLAVVRSTVNQFLAEDKNRWQASYEGTVVSNLSMACSLPALFKLCTEKALKEDPEMPIPASDKFLCRYLYPRTAAAAAAVSSSESLLEIRWALQQKILEKPNPDSYYNMSQYKYLKTFAVKLGNDKVTMIATDDKAGIDVGEPGLPIVACQHPGKSWIPSQLRLGEGQHTFHKFNLTPCVRAWFMIFLLKLTVVFIEVDPS